MPHAAGGRLQHDPTQGYAQVVSEVFQCRTRQVVGCNIFDLSTDVSQLSSFNAARGRWSVATTHTGYIQDVENMFQCRTRQVVGCNFNVIGGKPERFGFNAARGRWSVATW